jgi:hypothetical protein
MRSPAYSGELRAALDSGARVNLFCFIGPSAWERARRWPIGNRLVLPTDRAALANTDLAVAAGLELVLVADTNLSTARLAATRLCAHGARLAVLLHPELPHFAEFFYGEP